jgi:hypothetical protein
MSRIITDPAEIGGFGCCDFCGDVAVLAQDCGKWGVDYFCAQCFADIEGNDQED